MFRYKLRTLLIVLALGPPVIAVPCLIVKNSRDTYDLWHNPARYHELEEHLIKRGVCRRGADGELRINNEYARSHGWLPPNDN
jgi:hypothetical protein